MYLCFHCFSVLFQAGDCYMEFALVTFCTLSDSLLSVLECLLNSSDVHVCGLLFLLRIADIFFCVLTLLTV